MSILTKVYSRKVKKEINYTTTKNVLEELHILELQKGWAILQNLKILKERKADSFSFTRDHPYYYFYARATEESIIIKLKTKKKEIEFRIPIKEIDY
jgi:hypothetical protein